MFVYSFEKLEVWKDSRDLIRKVYLLTQKFPAEEKFGLVAQIRKSAISVSSNPSRISNKEQAHFTEISFGSLLEMTNQFIAALDLGYIHDVDYADLRSDIEKISNKSNALRKAQLSKDA